MFFRIVRFLGFCEIVTSQIPMPDAILFNSGKKPKVC